MKRILILGAGKSATALIHYLLEHAEQYDWHVVVGDRDQSIAAQKIDGNPRGTAIAFDVNDADLCAKCVQESDIVVSVLPAQFHLRVAEDCLRFGKHIITPSYVKANELALDAAFKEAGLLFMGELGLDPGIDHMSLMQLIGEVKAFGGEMTAIRSFTGALIAPESDTNPWHYKFTWAPMNVVLAGQGTARYLRNGSPQYVPYNRLFDQIESYEVPETGTFEAYANRDSLPYLDTYHIEGVPTFIRGTLRFQGYCKAWNALVRLGLTDNTFTIPDADQLSWAALMDSYLPPFNRDKAIDQRTADFLQLPLSSPIIDQLRWLGLFSDTKIKTKAGSPAQILHDLLVEKWVFQPEDRDMIVMLHVVDYSLNGKSYRKSSSLTLKGDAKDTAISYTVGLPMAIMTKLILLDKIDLTGVHIPIQEQVYTPLLEELKQFDIEFKEQLEEIS